MEKGRGTGVDRLGKTGWEVVLLGCKLKNWEWRSNHCIERQFRSGLEGYPKDATSDTWSADWSALLGSHRCSPRSRQLDENSYSSISQGEEPLRPWSTSTYIHSRKHLHYEILPEKYGWYLVSRLIKSSYPSAMSR
jgi:hypothetical protein